MAAGGFLPQVKEALGITGDYQDETIKGYIEETVGYLEDAGVQAAYITPGIVARGVADLWHYGAGEARFSGYFIQRAIQLAYKGPRQAQAGGTGADDTLQDLAGAAMEIHEAVVDKGT